MDFKIIMYIDFNNYYKGIYYEKPTFTYYQRIYQIYESISPLL